MTACVQTHLARVRIQHTHLQHHEGKINHSQLKDIYTYTLLLVIARKLMTSREILLWMTPSEAPKALQASECSELLDPTRASCWISAQHQPGKFGVGSKKGFFV